MTTMTKKTYTIDATGKSLGRVASEAAKMLRGKGETDFERHELPKVAVTITNASKAKIMDKKLKEKVYQTYSGYPGGQKEESMGNLAKRKGCSEIFRLAILGMIPNNKLRPVIMKHLKIQD